MKQAKTNLKKNHNKNLKTKTKKKASKILWITIVIHNAICVDKQ
jgi:hypothetical protein